jgi:hypothetical protein
MPRADSTFFLQVHNGKVRRLAGGAEPLSPSPLACSKKDIRKKMNPTLRYTFTPSFKGGNIIPCGPELISLAHDSANTGNTGFNFQMRAARA